MEQWPHNKIIVLYDGDCGLCNRAIQILLREDPADHFRFVSQQAALGKSILAHIGYFSQSLDSIVVYHPNVAYYTQSEAVFYICKHASNKLKLALVFQVFPGFILNFIYNYVAKNRFKWFGKSDQCEISNQADAAKFLS
jgi:predicted DCC family thiol-disulfide oxidoreductase YuxK